MDEKIIDDAFQAKEEEIKAVVAEVVAAEKGIEEHRQGIANLTVALVVARYRLGSLLMSLPGAAGNLKQAKGAWLKKAVELCGNRDRVYGSRDVANYFDDPFDSAIRASGTTGEERAAAFHGTLAELEQLVRYKRDHDASERKREREEAERAASRQGTALVQGAVARVAAGAPEEHDYFGLLRKMREEAGTAADRRKPAAVQGAAARIAPRPSGENVDSLKADADEPESEVGNGSLQLDAGTQGEPGDQEEGQDDRAVAASEFVGLFGDDVQQAVAYLIEQHWNKVEALEWLTAWVSNKRSAAKPPDGPWPPVIACGEVPEWENAKAGQYVTWGPSRVRVMVVDSVAESEIVLEDPFDQWAKYPIFVTRDKWDEVQATTEEFVRSEFARLDQDIPTGQPKKKHADDKKQTVRRKPADRKPPLAALAGVGA